MQAAAQIPDVHIWFGPDTYMGDNLAHMFQSLAEMPDEQIRHLHPAHDQASVRSLLPRFHYFEQGTCIVHHMFGREVVELVRENYPDVFVTAHLEVPGEMFELGLKAQSKGNGVVGSTSNILAFVLGKVDEAIARGEQANLRFILGTEAGMITPIVRQVQASLRGLRVRGRGRAVGGDHLPGRERSDRTRRAERAGGRAGVLPAVRDAPRQVAARRART